MAKTILVIDDNKKFSLGLTGVLKREGFNVKTAYDGAEGLLAIRTEKPDLILCDVMMPPPNGLMLKKELAKDPLIGAIPFLFLTARADTFDKQAGFDNGADDYITKPFDVNDLLARIKSILRRDELGHQRGLLESEESIKKLKQSISANLSHELRTPLSILLSTLDLIVLEKYTQSNEDLNHYIINAMSSAYRIKFITEDLVMLHDIDIDKINVFRQKIDHKFHLLEPINQTIKTWKNKKINLQIKINPDLEVYASRYEFGHVVSHLVDNAIKFSPENGAVTVTVDPNGVGGCFFEISDEGEGIPSAFREEVFERYFQIHQGDTREYGGLGVGLFIARSFARKMQGDIQIMDCLVGCKIRMVLPPYALD